MRSESTSAFGQPRLTKPTRGARAALPAAGLARGLRRRVAVAVGLMGARILDGRAGISPVLSGTVARCPGAYAAGMEILSTPAAFRRPGPADLPALLRLMRAF